MLLRGIDHVTMSCDQVPSKHPAIAGRFDGTQAGDSSQNQWSEQDLNRQPHALNHEMPTH